jgi:GntR family transcriptional regulator / MocR family aminotransferase
MSSTAPLLALALDRKATEPLNRQLYTELRQAILTGRAKPGVRLPATRTLADELGLSRNTVQAAIDQLEAEGYVEGRVGSGTYVSHVLPDRVLSVGAPKRGAAPAPAPARLSERGRAIVGAAQERPPAHPTFALGMPDLDGFPAAAWGKLMTRWWRHPRVGLWTARDAGGWPPLRAAIADYLRAVRGLTLEPEQVIVTSGAQQGIDLVARVLLDPGDEVWVEEPGYPGLKAAFIGAGAKPVPVQVDSDGLSVADGAKRAPRARLAAVSPSHQFPLGITMSLARRLALIDWAAKAEAWILEDDYNSEYRYEGRPLAALQGLEAHGRVIYVGSFSKVLFPSLRLGYLVAPAGLVDAFRRARQAMDDHPSIIAQPVVAEFIASGQFAAHVRRMRARYAERQAALVEQVRKQLDGRLTIEANPAGMHLVGALADTADDLAISRRAQAERVTVAPLSFYYSGSMPRRGLLLGYAAASERQIAAGVERLARVIG